VCSTTLGCGLETPAGRRLVVSWKLVMIPPPVQIIDLSNLQVYRPTVISSGMDRLMTYFTAIFCLEKISEKITIFND